MKKTLLLATLLVAAVGLHAQDTLKVSQCGNIDKGFGTAGWTMTTYTHLNGNISRMYRGNSITGILIGLNEDASNVYVYIKHYAADAENVYRQKVGNLKAGWNEVQLDTPLPIDGSPIAIGYRGSFKRKDGVGVSASESKDSVYVNSKSEWREADGLACIEAYIGGPAMPERQLGIIALNDARSSYQQESTAITGVVQNYGTRPVSSYTLACQVGDQELDDVTFDHAIAISARDTFSLSIPKMEAGAYKVTVTIKSVNGAEDEFADDNTLTAKFVQVSDKFIRRFVQEEATGTWCGWCPRGLVTLDEMKKLHPGVYIPISIHSEREQTIKKYPEWKDLVVDAFQPFLDKISTFPNGIANRMTQTDNMDLKTTEYVFEDYASRSNAYGITADATYDESTKQVTAHTTVNVNEPLTSQNLWLAYAVTEDSVTGYKQANSYSGGASGEMGGWENKASVTDDFVYDDLARGIFPDYDGVAFASENLEPGVNYDHDYTFTMPDNVRNPEKTHIIALLINHSSGEVVNAFSVVPEIKKATGINAVHHDANATVEGYYSINGMRLSKPQPGICIIKMTDGTVRKMVVK